MQLAAEAESSLIQPIEQIERTSMDLKTSNIITSSTDDSPRWQSTLERVVAATVAIKFSTVRHFDTERAGYGVATGFVVDKQRGLILTNRHVVRPGPVTAEATFLDHEEVDLYPVYRDPVHDFGFYRFNPAEIKYMNVSEIALAPNDAKVGTEIRIIGNDAGEKLSILSGTLARLDRPAPTYGEDKYNDFNTFYYQAASGTSGGSSGSPVVDINGKAIALVAGGKKKAASSFYLPLNKPLRALQYLQKGLPIPRGTIQTVFRHCPYDEVHRLGLLPSTEAVVRSTAVAGEVGMLVVDQVIPGGPALDKLEPGDILVRMNGELVTSFNHLEDIFDSNIETDITLDVERGGTPMSLIIKVQDLHSITPDKYLEIGGGILHPLSYQQAKNFRLPVGAVYVASEGYMFGGGGIQRGSIITSVGQTLTPTIEVLEKVMSQLADRSRIPVRYFCMNDRHSERLAVIRVDRCWHPMQLWTRDDITGVWNCSTSPSSPLPQHAPKPVSATPIGATGLAAKVVPSLVMVNFTVPFVVDGGSNDTFIGAGVIVDEKAGLVLVDQNTVPLPLGDLTITFGATAELPGEVVFLHPVHNFAILKYDPSLLQGNFPAAVISKTPLAQGDDVLFVGLSRKFQPLWQTTNIARIEELFIPEPRPPRFRAVNEEVIHLEKPPSCVGGVLVDSQGQVQCFWASYSSSDRKDPNTPVEFFRGFTADLVEDVLKQLRQGQEPALRSLETELWPISLAQARDVGLSEEWLAKIQGQTARRHILNVRRLVADSDAAKKLKTGDLLLAVDGKLCSSFRDVEIATQDAEKVRLTLLRNMEEVEETVSTVLLTGKGTTKIACWAGAILQNTHRPVAQLGFLHEGVYCSRWYFGSPAHKYSLRAAHWIVEVNGKPTPDLDTFLNVVNTVDANQFVRLKIRGLQDRVTVTTLKLDLHYWPTWVLDKKGKDWVLQEVTQQSRPQAP